MTHCVQHGVQHAIPMMLILAASLFRPRHTAHHHHCRVHVVGPNRNYSLICDDGDGGTSSLKKCFVCYLFEVGRMVHPLTPTVDRITVRDQYPDLPAILRLSLVPAGRHRIEPKWSVLVVCMVLFLLTTTLLSMHRSSLGVGNIGL